MVQIRKIKNLKILNPNKIQDSTLRLTDSSKRIIQKIFGFTLYLVKTIIFQILPPYIGLQKAIRTAYME